MEEIVPDLQKKLDKAEKRGEKLFKKARDVYEGLGKVASSEVLQKPPTAINLVPFTMGPLYAAEKKPLFQNYTQTVTSMLEKLKIGLRRGGRYIASIPVQLQSEALDKALISIEDRYKKAKSALDADYPGIERYQDALGVLEALERRFKLARDGHVRGLEASNAWVLEATRLVEETKQILYSNGIPENIKERNQGRVEAMSRRMTSTQHSLYAALDAVARTKSDSGIVLEHVRVTVKEATRVHEMVQQWREALGGLREEIDLMKERVHEAVTKAVKEIVDRVVDKKSRLPVVGRGALRPLVQIFTIPPLSMVPSEFDLQSVASSQKWFRGAFAPLRKWPEFVRIYHWLHPFTETSASKMVFGRDTFTLFAAAAAVASVNRRAMRTVRVVVPSETAKDLFLNIASRVPADMNLIQLTQGLASKATVTAANFMETLRTLRAHYQVDVLKTNRRLKEYRGDGVICIWLAVPHEQITKHSTGRNTHIIMSRQAITSNSGDFLGVFSDVRPLDHVGGALTPESRASLAQDLLGRVFHVADSTTLPKATHHSVLLNLAPGTLVDIKGFKGSGVDGLEDLLYGISTKMDFSSLRKFRQSSPALHAVVSTIMYMEREGGSDDELQVVYVGGNETRPRPDRVSLLVKAFVDLYGYIEGGGDSQRRRRGVIPVKCARDWVEVVEVARKNRAVGIVILDKVDDDSLQWAMKGRTSTLHLTYPIVDDIEMRRVVDQVGAQSVVHYSTKERILEKKLTQLLKMETGVKKDLVSVLESIAVNKIF